MEMKMFGITCSFDAVLVSDVDFKMTKNGTLPLASMTMVIEERSGKTFLAKVNLFGDKAKALVGQLAKGQRVHVEGIVSLNTWTGKDGCEKTGLLVTANMVRPSSPEPAYWGNNTQAQGFQPF